MNNNLHLLTSKQQRACNQPIQRWLRSIWEMMILRFWVLSLPWFVDH